MQDILAPDFDDCGTTPSVVEVCKTVLKSLLLFRISPIKLKWSASTFTLKTGTFALKTGTFALKTGTFELTVANVMGCSSNAAAGKSVIHVKALLHDHGQENATRERTRRENRLYLPYFTMVYCNKSQIK